MGDEQMSDEQSFTVVEDLHDKAAGGNSNCTSLQFAIAEEILMRLN